MNGLVFAHIWRVDENYEMMKRYLKYKTNMKDERRGKVTVKRLGTAVPAAFGSDQVGFRDLEKVASKHSKNTSNEGEK